MNLFIFQAQETFVEYKNKKYPLSDDADVVFVDGECVIDLDVRKTESSPHRAGKG